MSATDPLALTVWGRRRQVNVPLMTFVPRARRPVLAAGEASATGRPTMASGEATTLGFRHLDPEPGWALEHFVDGYLRTKERELFR